MDYYGALFLIGRVLLGGYFLRNAYNHLVHTQQLMGYASSKGVSSPRFAVISTGLLLLIGGLGILLGRYVDWSVLALVIFLGPVSFKMHAYWKITDPMQKMGESVNFWKNLALLGAVLMLLMLPEPWLYSFGG